MLHSGYSYSCILKIFIILNKTISFSVRNKLIVGLFVFALICWGGYEVTRLPISGYVSKVNVNQGKYIAPTDVLFELIDPSELHADLQVFENDARGLRQGQTVVCTPTNNPDVKIETRIEYITHNIDENRAVEVHCHLDKPVKGLLPGNFITGEIQLNNQSVNAIPDEGLVKRQGKNYVFVTSDSKTFSLMPVTIGASADGFTAINSVLPTSNVVYKNTYALLTMLKNKADD